MLRAVLVGLLGVTLSFGATGWTNPAGAAARVAGLGACPSSTSCDLANLHHAFAGYRGVCPEEDCGMVAAADWESVAAGVVPSAAALANDFRSGGRELELGTDFAPLWSYWSGSGIAGEYLTSHAALSKDRAIVDAAVLTSKAVIAVAVLRRAAYIGVTRYSAGVADLVADGFTPKGPLVVFQQRTLQMTWAQWRAEVRAVWQPTVTSSAPGSGPSVTLSVTPATVPSGGGTATLSVSAPGAVTCSLSSVPDLWSTPTVAVPCDGSVSVSIAPASAATTWTITASASAADGSTSTTTETLAQEAPPPPAANSSPNWSGYVVPSSSALVTYASGDFVVPTLDCAVTPTGHVFTWVGIGGEQWSTGGSSGVLLQTGIDSSCVNGVQSDVAWWEVFPATPNHEQIFSGFPVSPGDTIQAVVFQMSSGAWETLLSDEATGLSALMVTGESWGVGPTSTGSISFTPQGSAAQISYAGGYTAEWIVEDPGSSITQALEPFADFGTVTFSNLRTSLTAWSLTPDETWAIVQGGMALASPTQATTDGFTVSYTSP